jgi:hypothetical protein
VAKKLGKIEKPPVEKYRTGRKLFFAPLIFTPREPQADFLKLINSYWSQVEAQVSKLEAMLNDVDRVYHELITVGGKKGMKVIEKLNSGSYQVARTRVKKGAKLQPIEDDELLTEFMDWSKCLAVGLQNQKVFTRVYECYIEVQKRRNNHIAKQIDKTLKSNGTGILLMREGHQLQFPPDIEVFYIAPPSLDEIKRWLRARGAEA